jgi:hypothetical protein
MKYLLIIFIGLSFCFGCHKKKDDPAPTIYTDSLAGTYSGQETQYQGAPSGTVSYSNGSQKVTITVVGTNRIKVMGLYDGGLYYDVTGVDSYGRKNLVAESPCQNYGKNTFDPSNKSLSLYFKGPLGEYDSYSGTKQ